MKRRSYVYEVGLYHVCCRISNFSITPYKWDYGEGHVTDLTPDDLDEKSEIYEM